MDKLGLVKAKIVLVAFLIVFTGCRNKEQSQLPLVIVDKPAKEDVQIFGEYVGRIRAASFVEVHARVEGYLEKMLFEEGKQRRSYFIEFQDFMIAICVLSTSISMIFPSFIAIFNSCNLLSASDLI